MFSYSFMAVNHEQIKFPRMPRGRNQMPYYAQCPDNEMQHMQRGPCFTDNYGKMDGPCNMGISEFKSPMMNADPPPPPPKKKRRASNAMTAATQQAPPQDLLPPPLTGYGDTIVASNPFDDTPPAASMSHMNPMNHVNKHMGIRPCMSPAGGPMMDSMSPCQIVGSPMPCGPPVGSPINCPPLGNCSPMSGPGNNPNCGPIGSPHGSCTGRQVNRSPLVCAPMSTNSVMSNSQMNVNSVHSMNRSPSSMGSPLGSVTNLRGNSPMDPCGMGISSVGSQKGSPMSVMSSHNMSNLNCGSPMGSPSNVPMSSCNSGNMIGSPITSPLNVPCSMGGGSDMNINMNSVMNRSPMNAPPNSVNSSIMCNASMRGPSPLGSGPMNGPMSMNCGPNMNMGPKSDMNMNELVMRDNCGSPLHLPVKSHNGPSGPCGMNMNNGPCTRQPDIAGMQCNPMMSNQCSPGMGNVSCIGGNMSRSQCSSNPMGPMGMNNMYDGMGSQCRPPPMNRSQFPRGMPNISYGANNMNMQPAMNGPSMNMCGGPPDVGNLACVPSNPAGNPNNSMHCPGDNPMNSSQCMGSNMNQCSGPMFNSQFNPFEVNNPRCSPNLPFTTSHEMSMNNNFYRSNMSNASSCMSNINASASSGSGDSLRVSNTIVSTANSLKNDGNTVDSDISRVVCNITNDGSDDLNLLDENLLRDTKPEDCKSAVKDMLLDDHPDNKENSSVPDGKQNENDSDNKLAEEKESKADNKSGKTDSILSTSPTGNGGGSGATSAAASSSTAVATDAAATTSICSAPNGTNTTTVNSRTGTITTSISSSNTNNGCDVGSSNDNAEHSKGGVCKTETIEEDEYSFNKLASQTSNDKNENTTEDASKEDKIKSEPEEKLLENEFGNDDDEKKREEKSSGSEDAAALAKLTNENAIESEQRKDGTPSGGGVSVKVERDDFYESNLKNKTEVSNNGRPGNGNNNDFNNGKLMGGVASNFNANLPPGAEIPPNMVNNSNACMNDSMCGSPMLSNMNNMNRLAMPPHSLNQSNYQNKSINMYPGRIFQPNKSKLYNNAPAIYTCALCHKEINENGEEAILCESGCYSWFHRTCCGLTEDACRLLKEEAYAEYVCDQCLNTKQIPLVKLRP